MAFVKSENSLPAQTAGGGTSVTRIGMVPYSFSQNVYDVERITVVPAAALTGDATNNATVNVRRNRAGTATVIGTLTTTASWVSGTPVNVPVTAGSQAQAGDIIDVQLVQNASGVAITVGAWAAVELA